jgi:hypothetical protein
MNGNEVISLLAGAVAMAYLLAGFFFLKFWHKTKDRFFLLFALAFWMFTLNQIVTTLLGESDERSGYAYVLRVLGYVVILFAIIQKNASSQRPGGN